MRYIIFTLTLIFSFSSYSQDKIYFKDGSKIEAKVLTVSESQIQYKKFNNLSGPTFEIGISKINLIIYEDGSDQIFNKKNVQTIRDTFLDSSSSENIFQNRINLDLLAFGQNGPTSLSYELINKDGSLGIEFPLNFYFRNRGVVGFSTGANLKFYPVKNQGKGFYYGPSLGLGFIDWPYYYYGNSFEQYGYSREFTTFLGSKLGYQFQITKLIGISLGGNLGLLTDYSYLDFGYSLNLGINFSF
tara:strand:- start:617 stop:1348 length:732 start_codon:yes stop_codon:yes gene_type:complete